MVGEWERVPLGDLVDPDRGISYGIVQPGQPVDNGVPIIRVANIRESRIDTSAPLRVSPEIEHSYARTRLQGGELLITIVGTIGETAIVPNSLAGWNVARAIAVIPVKKEIGAYWVQLALGAQETADIIHSRLNTTVQPTLNLGDLARLPILVPPRTEREAISRIICALDDKIDVNRKMAATLEAMARALFKSWFVDFDPVRAKAEGRDCGLPPHIAALFPNRLIDTEEGELPEGWERGTLGEIADNPRRSAQPTDIPGGTPYIALEHMPRRSLALDEWANGDGVESNKYWFEKYEMLFGKLRPYFHKVGIAPVNGVCSTDIVVLRPSEPKWWSFLALVVSSVEFVAFTDQGSTGTKMPRTNWPDMSRYLLVLAGQDVVTAFDGMVRQMLERIISSVHESCTLAALRDTLLPKLISGDLRVKDAERFLAERGL